MIGTIVCLFCAAVPAAMFFRNVKAFRRAPSNRPQVAPRISVLIPARDEERSIEAAVRCVLASEFVQLECVVLDDHSSDGTAEIVSRLAREDPRVRVEGAPLLPAGWCGKQHACFVLSGLASHDLLCFLDADVRLAPDALWRMSAFADASGSPLVSGFPKQETRTWLERLLIPLVHFVLLGFLPISRMRESTSSAYAAGCGQLMMVRRQDYEAAGGHASIRTSLHDGIKLPAAFRRAGLRTDIFDATDVAVCRMYTNASEVWFGLTKNATEGMGAPARIVPITAILVGGQVLPFLLWQGHSWMLLAMALAWAPRMVAAVRFQQPMLSAVLHPLGILLLVGVQWYALIRRVMGRPSGWKDRVYLPAGN